MNPNIYNCVDLSGSWNLYAKKEYNEKVKTSLYEINLESKPFDNDVRNPKLDWFLPHYNRLGYDEHFPWITTTQDMLSQRLTAQETPNPNKKFLGYYTYHDEIEYLKKKKNPCPSQFAVNDYITTMQNSYKPQQGYITERLAMTETPFFMNRRFRIENRRESRNKFWDDDHLQEIKLLKEFKPNRQLSYNFMTGCMSDGSPISRNLYTKI
ncbi:uncharacterized protein LOC123310750 [Coccinella septempunctata]|uniref:uncharacterized protein LOC123310750 n=1 Tax=Coccinella septempunctata TaxID=41139 RepID=UPI001D0610CA|nr:uncharacterized protein LOC123310750 [Coccinella septempunctata]